MRIMGSGLIVCALIGGSVLGRAADARGQEAMGSIDQYLGADRNAEIAQARSAAPPAISDGATVYVLTRKGYEKAVTGKNGFVCFVDRAWQQPFSEPAFWNTKIRAPTCLNPQAARTVWPVVVKRTELALAGRSKAEIKTGLVRAFESKELKSPEVGAMSYMMSKNQYLDDRNKNGFPHVMFYVAHAVTNEDWGANVPKSPVLGGHTGSDSAPEPHIIFVVPVSVWSDGAPALASALH